MRGKQTGIKIEYAVLALVMMLSLLNIAYWGAKKEGYHLDEMYNYGYANSEYLPILHFGSHDYSVRDWMKEYGAGDSVFDLIHNLGKDFLILKDADFQLKNSNIYQDYLRAKAASYDMTTTTWVPGQDYIDYLTVARDSRFNFASVYYNSRGDAHPPLYYMLSHTICSIVPEAFSKWFGIGLNMFLMIFVLWALYLVVYKLTDDAVPALLATIVYAFSSGAVSTVLFIRMYTLLTLSFLIMLYVHLQIADDDFEIKGKHTKKLMFATILGYLSQYYFVFYAAALALVMTALFAKRKKWKQLCSYYIRLFWSAVIGICLWPFSIKQAFFSSRGTDTIDSFGLSFDFERWKVMFGHLTNYLFGDKGLLPWMLLVAVMIHIVLWKKSAGLRDKICLSFLPVLFYFLIVSKVVIFLADRYIMCIYPFVYLFIVVSVYFGSKYLLTKKRGIFSNEKNDFNDKIKKPEFLCTILTAFILLAFGNTFMSEPGYLFTNGQETIHLPAETDSIFVLVDGTYNESIEYASVLAKSNRVGISYLSDLQKLHEGYEEEKGKYLCVFMQDYMDENLVIEKVKEGLGTDALTEVERAQSYYVKRVLLKTGQ